MTNISVFYASLTVAVTRETFEVVTLLKDHSISAAIVKPQPVAPPPTDSSAMHRLYKDLFTTYNKFLRPVTDPKRPTNITVNPVLYSLIDIVRSNYFFGA